MSDETLSNQQLLDTILTAFDLRASDIARCLEVDKSALSKWAKQRGRLNTRAIAQLSQLWVQARSIVASGQFAETTALQLFTETEQDLVKDHQQKRLQEGIERLERQEEGLLRMQTTHFAVAERLRRLETLDLSQPPFEKPQQLLSAIWKSESRHELSLCGAVAQYEQALRIALTRFEVEHLKERLGLM